MSDRETSTYAFVPMLQAALAEGQTLDVALATIRAAGASQLLSVAAVAIVQRRSLVDAKQAVHLSSAWSDVQRGNETIADKLLSSLEQEA